MYFVVKGLFWAMLENHLSYQQQTWIKFLVICSLKLDWFPIIQLNVWEWAHTFFSMLDPFKFAIIKLSLKNCSLWASLLKWNSGVWDYYINYRKCTVFELRMSSQCCQGNSQNTGKSLQRRKKKWQRSGQPS